MAVENFVETGETIPSMTGHAVSVSFPTWRANVGYEEGEDWVVSKMKTGYPRFFIHKSVQKFERAIISRYGSDGEQAMLFPSYPIALRCMDWIARQVPESSHRMRIVNFVSVGGKARPEFVPLSPEISAVIYPREEFKTAKAFWQHSGDGISSRRAEYCHDLFKRGTLIDTTSATEVSRSYKGPRRYQKPTCFDTTESTNEQDSAIRFGELSQFIEERFGRNIDLSMAKTAKVAIRRRIASHLATNVGLSGALALGTDMKNTKRVVGLSEDDIYLYPCGMSAIFNTHQSLVATKAGMKSIVFGFPYTDTLKVIEKFGSGSLFYGFGSSEELDDLEKRLEGGERFLALFTEFPTNSLLRSPDLERIRKLADDYDFYVVIDETVGGFINVSVLPYGDVIVSSLTKVFSGDSNVMGGCAILNPRTKSYQRIKHAWENDYEDNYWAEDSIFLERNSRDLVTRVSRINNNAEAIADLLHAHPRVKQVNYPKYSPTRSFYEKCLNPKGGYGGLLSVNFHRKEDSATFFDNLDTLKGPSLGTNFTLSAPYVILAHYGELGWAAYWGLETELVRCSIGLEETSKLVKIFEHALEALPKQVA